MIIGVDVDGVVADLHTEWIRRHNVDYDWKTRRDQLSSWDAESWPISPECGKRIYDYLRQPDLYQRVPVIDGAQIAIRDLKKLGHRVVFVTSNAKGMTDQKWDWLERFGFLEVRYTHSDMVIAHDKALVKTDVLIDDKLSTVQKYPYPTILMDQPWNRSVHWATRAKGWGEVMAMLQVRGQNGNV